MIACGRCRWSFSSWPSRPSCLYSITSQYMGSLFAWARDGTGSVIGCRGQCGRTCVRACGAWWVGWMDAKTYTSGFWQLGIRSWSKCASGRGQSGDLIIPKNLRQFPFSLRIRFSFVGWVVCIPQRLQITCDLLWRLPKLEVPFAVHTIPVRYMVLYILLGTQATYSFWRRGSRCGCRRCGFTAALQSRLQCSFDAGFFEIVGLGVERAVSLVTVQDISARAGSALGPGHVLILADNVTLKFGVSKLREGRFQFGGINVNITGSTTTGALSVYQSCSMCCSLCRFIETFRFRNLMKKKGLVLYRKHLCTLNETHFSKARVGTSTRTSSMMSC